MKKYLIFASAVACLMAMGCVKDKEKDFSEDAIVFSASTSELETRTQYGATGTVNNKLVQYVDWVEGDKITILMSPAKGSSSASAHYTVDRAPTTGGSGSYSRAIISVAQGSSPLEWGTSDSYDFYAMYPSTDFVQGNSLSSSAGMTAVIPSSYSLTSDQIDNNRLPYGYMMAKKTMSRSTSVELDFYPKFTAFCFTLKNTSTSKSVPLSSISLTSVSKAMSGSFTVASPDADPVLNSSNSNKTITVNFPRDFNIPVASNKDTPGQKTFTIVTLPDSYSDLTVTVTQVIDQNEVSKSLKLGKTNEQLEFEWIEFAAGKKHNISVTLPEFTHYDYTLTVTSPTDLDYAAGTSNTGRITSKRSDGTAVSWSVENYYASAENAESKTNPLGAQTWVTSGLGTNMTGGENLALNIVHTAITPDETTISTDIASIINGEISGKSSVGTESEPINLANSSGGTGTYITESANCYIVNGPGWYKIPLVMGNGVKGNRTNSQSLSYTGRAYSGTNYTQQFVDYKNQIVTSPYLQNSNSVSGKKPGTPSSASVVWQDVSGLVNSCSIMASTSTTSDNNTVFWLEFEVPSGTVQQGNAVIAVYDTDSASPTVDQIMWSYHIWVSNHTSEMDISNYMPYLLGWKATGGSITKKSFKVYARLEQVSPGTEHAILELECPESTVQNHFTTGSALYYQWGRKDPLHSTDTQKASTSAGFTYNYVYSFRYPTSFLRHGQNAHVKTFWVGSDNKYRNAYNLWNATNETTGIGKTVVKTIYDPSPAGYTVPASNSLGTLDVGVVNASYRYMRSSANAPYDAIWQTDKILLWSAAPSADNHAYYYEGTASSTGYSFSSGSSEHYCHLGNALPVLPVVDTSYDPTDNGVLGSGTGPNINWQN